MNGIETDEGIGSYIKRRGSPQYSLGAREIRLPAPYRRRYVPIQSYRNRPGLRASIDRCVRWWFPIDVQPSLNAVDARVTRRMK